MIIKHGLYINCNFFYKVGYSLGDLKNRYYHHEEHFMGNNLQELRRKAFDYYNSRCEWAYEQQSFFNSELKIHGPNGFKKGDHIAFGPYIYFTHDEDGQDYDYPILDGFIMNISEEVLMSREFENSIYQDELKLDVPWPDLPDYY